jgi:hypothetical protein
LDIPDTLKIHPVFHVSILHPYSNPDSITHHSPSSPPPSPISIQDHEEFEVERILDHRCCGAIFTLLSVLYVCVYISYVVSSCSSSFS